MDNEKALNMDVFILMSWINTKLRDEFDSLSNLCTTYDLDIEMIIIRLKEIGYFYNEKNNQFVLL